MDHAKKLSENEIRRLAYIKGMLRTGIKHLENGTEPDVALATLIFDNCIEMMLWLLIDQFGVKISGDKYLPQLLSKLNNEVNNKNIETLSDNSLEIIALHEARNSVQHYGNVPRLSDIQRFRLVAENVLKKTSEDCLGIQWNEISLALLIADSRVKNLYYKAEDNYQNGQSLNAALALVSCFELMKLKETTRLYGSGISFTRIKAHQIEENCQDENLKNLGEYIRIIDCEVEILKLGLDYKSFQKYREFIPIEPFDYLEIPDGSEEAIIDSVRKKYKQFVNEKNNESPDIKGWVNFAFGFILDSILHWQSIERNSFSESLIQLLTKGTTGH